jgi:glycosyltransferase involved in cell wall biosynthesis
MHAGILGGADRYFDGLCRAFSAMKQPFSGFVFEGKAGQCEVPDGVHVLCSSDSTLTHRIALLRKFVTDRTSQTECGRNDDGWSCGKEVVASHFSLYSWPVIHPLPRRRRNVVAVSHFHGPWADESFLEGASQFTVSCKRSLEKWVYRSSDRVLTVSEAFRRIAIDSYGVSPDRVVAIPAAIDTTPFVAVSSLPRDLARNLMGWPVKRRIVFCLRRLTRRMGLDRLVEAWSAVVEVHPDALLVIGGRGPLRDVLERQIRTAGLEQHVMLVGFVPGENLPFAYRAAEFSVVPSVALEGFGLVILESLATGTPVMTTPVGGMPEIMRPLEPGLVLEGVETRHLEKGIVALLAGRLPAPAETNCVEYVQRNYNWEVAATRVLNEYHVACASAVSNKCLDYP